MKIAWTPGLSDAYASPTTIKAGLLMMFLFYWLIYFLVSVVHVLLINLFASSCIGRPRLSCMACYLKTALVISHLTCITIILHWFASWDPAVGFACVSCSLYVCDVCVFLPSFVFSEPEESKLDSVFSCCAVLGRGGLLHSSQLLLDLVRVEMWLASHFLNRILYRIFTC